MGPNYFTRSKNEYICKKKYKERKIYDNTCQLKFLVQIINKSYSSTFNCTSTRFETIAIVVFLVIILAKTCSFFCTIIDSWQVGLVVSCPCVLPELSSTDLSICMQV